MFEWSFLLLQHKAHSEEHRLAQTLFCADTLVYLQSSEGTKLTPLLRTAFNLDADDDLLHEVNRMHGTLSSCCIETALSISGYRNQAS